MHLVILPCTSIVWIESPPHCVGICRLMFLPPKHHGWIGCGVLMMITSDANLRRSSSTIDVCFVPLLQTPKLSEKGDIDQKGK